MGQKEEKPKVVPKEVFSYAKETTTKISAPRIVGKPKEIYSISQKVCQKGPRNFIQRGLEKEVGIQKGVRHITTMAKTSTIMGINHTEDLVV